MGIRNGNVGLLHWCVRLNTRTPDGRRGEQSIIVAAVKVREAEQLAWEQAHTPEAVRSRRGAAIISKRHQLRACSIAGSQS
ncbi:hypothetical protein [Streptacidiphilus sp. PAMC 29251]